MDGWRRPETIAMMKMRKNEQSDLAQSLCRSLSKCLDPQDTLLEAMATGDEESLRSVLADLCPISDDSQEKGLSFPLAPSHWLNSSLGSEQNHKNVLHLALDKGDVKLIKLLLNAGVRADVYNDNLGLAPIHVAVLKGNLNVVKALLDYMNDSKRLNVADINVVDAQGQSCLHLATQKKHLEVLHYLCQHPKLKNIDARDLKGRRTPLFVAAINGFPEAAEILIAHGANLDIKCLGKGVNEALKERLPYFDASKVKRLRPLNTSFDEGDYLNRLLDKAQMNLRKGLSNKPNLVEFNVYTQHKDASWLSEVDGGGQSLMQKACDYGLDEHVSVLMEAGVNVNLRSKECDTHPVLMAAYNGHFRLLQALKKCNQTFHASNGQKGQRVLFSACDSTTNESILHSILKRPNPSTPKDHYKRCLDQILDNNDIKLAQDMAIVINRKDVVGNVALHYAILGRDENVVLSLLELGANVGIRNVWEETPIHLIKPETMEKFLDDFCIKHKNDVADDDFELEFNYSFLAPPTLDELTAPKEEDSLDNADTVDEERKPVLPETESLWYMSRSEKHKYLLKHPVVNSFLYLKWNKIRPYFNRNLRFYLLLVTCLTWYIFERFGGVHTRSTTNTSASASFCSELSTRTSITNFGMMYSLFVVQSIIQVVMMISDWRRDCLNCNKSTWAPLFFAGWLESLMTLIMLAIIVMGIRALYTSLTILTLLLLLREMLQMTASVKRYMLSPENWLELSLVLLIAIMLWIPDKHLGSNACDLQRHVAAVAILFSWAELITLIARHPALNVYTVYVNMFYRVLSTFFFFLLWYSFFVIAFALGFYIMLHRDTQMSSNESASDDGNETKNEDEYALFNYPWSTLVKTTTMFIGEIEFADIPVDLDSSLAVFSYLFLLAFILLIVVVLMNLLKGLAVSDTGAIRLNAEIVAATARVHNISYIESLLMGDPFDFLSNWPPILTRMPSLGLCRTLHRTRFGQHLALGITGATGILVFYSTLKEKKLVIKPNRKNNRQFCGNRRELSIGEDILTDAKAIIVAKREKGEDHIDKNDLKFELLEAKVGRIEDKLDAIIKALGQSRG